ncbi:MAG: translation initiation factor IF-2 subunit gamma [Nanoarchaeota archaeon]|nr:translation initiation factor IF-2 subunit gamma [Nanoarchaeota archaeon]
MPRKKKETPTKETKKRKSKKTEKVLYPEVNIGTIGHIAHGKTTLVYQLTGKRTQEHSEEIKRGLTIRLGYADFTVRKCKKCGKYSVKNPCPYCGGETEPVRRISFVDAPGHETLMATMLTGAATMDGAILVIAANEPCPQPQTREHLLALEISGVKNIIIVQNKIDLVDEKQALENYKQIKEFVKGTIAEDAPIIPISAQYGANMDVLLEAMEKYIPTPKRDLKADPIFLIARSFDVNKPGTDVLKLIGGVIGGVLKQGKLKIGDTIEILPGRQLENKNKWVPIQTKIDSLSTGDIPTKEIVPGGSSGIGTELDPSVTKSDALVGQIVGLPGKMPPVWYKLKLKVHLLKRVVGSKEELEIQPLKTNEPLMINAWTARSVGIITSAHDDIIEMTLKLPICISKDARIVISRRIGQKWRLVGYGEIID